LKKSIICFSGGIDSTVLLAMALKNNRECLALCFDYGQRHIQEIQAAQKIANYFEVPFKVIKFDTSIFSNTPLTSSSDLEVPKNRSIEDISSRDISPCYVPARNTLFLSIAFGHAEILNADEIYLGANADDQSFPDCLPGYFKAFNSLLKEAQTTSSTLTLETPLIEKSKQEIIAIGNELNVPFEMTLSCYDPTENGEHCGQCDTCYIRRDAFKNAGVSDPTNYLAYHTQG
jgi:7-cyano-7-deazaguanine synthase